MKSDDRAFLRLVLLSVLLAACGCSTWPWPSPTPTPEPDPGFADFPQCRWMGYLPLRVDAVETPNLKITGASLRGRLMYFSYDPANKVPAWTPTADAFCIGPFACAWISGDGKWYAGAVDHMAINPPPVHDAGNLLKTETGPNQVPWAGHNPTATGELWVCIYRKDGTLRSNWCRVTRE